MRHYYLQRRVRDDVTGLSKKLCDRFGLFICV